MPDHPTLHVTNWSSRKLYGPGRKLTIMAMPRHWEHGDGKIVCLTPPEDWVQRARAGELSLADYRRGYEACLDPEALTPGVLGGLLGPNPEGRVSVPVRDGDTLCCACSREAASRGECHRVWAAEALVKAGWIVVLDGTTILPEGVLPRTTLNDIEAS